MASSVSAPAPCSPTASTCTSSSVNAAPANGRSRVRTPRRCGFPECTKTAKRGGLCISHGGGKKCAIEGCQTSVVSRGVCVAHGGGKRCQHAGCPKSAQTGGFCWLHGGGTKCSHEGCSKRAQSGGACISHGGGRRCRIAGCNKVVQYDGLCVGHGGYRHCRSLECHKKALANGYCAQHGRRERERGRSSALHRKLGLGLQGLDMSACQVVPLPPMSVVGGTASAGQTSSPPRLSSAALVHPLISPMHPAARLPSATTLLPPLRLPCLRDLQHQHQTWHVETWRHPPLQLHASASSTLERHRPAKIATNACFPLARGLYSAQFQSNTTIGV